MSRKSYIYPYKAALEVSRCECVVRALLLGPTKRTIRQLAELAKQLGFTRIGVIDSNGRVVVVSDGTGEGINLSDRQYVRNTLRGEAAQTAVISRGTGKHYVVTTSPVWTQTKTPAVIGGVLLFNLI